MNVKERLRAENAAQLVIQLNAAMAQLHKKCDFAYFTLIVSFKLNSDDKTNKSHISFIHFRKCALHKYAFREEQ